MRRFAKNFAFWLAASVAASSGAIASEGATCEVSHSAPAGIDRVYPSADLLPENLLRFYVYFSQPMEREKIWDHIALLDGDGDVVPGAFIENRFDLWSPDDTRLTVLFDPGRVKTGLVAHDTMGRALEPGKAYTLQVRPTAKTRAGCAMTEGFEKPFHAVAADFDAPDLSAWQITAPAAGTRDPLTLHVNGAMDHISLAYRIRVADQNGVKLKGALRLGENEASWIFTPKTPWGTEAHQIEVNTTLEDIAGNRLTGLFDRPLDTAGYSEPTSDVGLLPFTPRSEY